MTPPDRRVSERLPDFPWDQLAAYAATARAHPDGIVDLSVGTPVDPTPDVVQDALRAAADSPGYPTTQGLPETRQAAVDWLARRHGVTGLGSRRRAAGDRLQGADRLAARPPRARRRATWSATRSSPTRRTRWGQRCAAPGASRPTR